MFHIPDLRRVSASRVIATLLLPVLASCTTDRAVTGPTPIEPPSVRQVPVPTSVIVDPATLAGFVTRGGNRAVPVVLPPAVSPRIVAAADRPALAAMQAAIKLGIDIEVKPPEIDGKVLQATHIAVAAGRAYVTYAMIGETTAGAIDVFDVPSSSPAADVAGAEETKLIARMTFTSTEYYAVTATDAALYVVGASDDPELQERAVLDIYGLRDGIFDSKPVFKRIALPSFAGTGVHVQDGLVWTTSGDGGGVTVFSEKELSVINRVPLKDARAVHGSGKFVVVLAGLPGRTVLFDAGTSKELTAATDVGGASIPESKGSVWVEGAWAFLGTGDGGVRVLAIGGQPTLRRVEGIPMPEVKGIAPELSTTNAVTTNGTGLVFTADGETGVHVYDSDYLRLTRTSRSPTPRFEPVGALDFGERISANFIASTSTQLFVASGLGGLKILRIQ